MPRRPEDIELDVRLTLDWRAADLVEATFQGAVKAVLATLREARNQAQKNVAPGRGPGPHPHRTEHGFTWEDTGKLERAIDIERGFTELTSGKYVGTPSGKLVVKPIKVPITGMDGEAPDAGGTRLVPYGAYLEMGYTPMIWTHNGLVAGHWTRYPFLAPAMYMASARFPARAAVSMRQELVDMAAKAKKRKAIFEKQPILYGDMLYRYNLAGVLSRPVQRLKNLDRDDD